MCNAAKSPDSCRPHCRWVATAGRLAALVKSAAMFAQSCGINPTVPTPRLRASLARCRHLQDSTVQWPVATLLSRLRVNQILSLRKSFDATHFVGLTLVAAILKWNAASTDCDLRGRCLLDLIILAAKPAPVTPASIVGKTGLVNRLQGFSQSSSTFPPNVPSSSTQPGFCQPHRNDRAKQSGRSTTMR